ncbi:endonuclease/exonuclease/phosphatase family protein [Nonomuraea dietziae]|uniref:endonuclease/exonuclease/phosphatase family protein n=1 Tax=Nonomuraea dietziae TaxID=65515 RepID=UPI0033F76DF1
MLLLALGLALLIDVLRVFLPSLITLFGRAGETPAELVGLYAALWFVLPCLAPLLRPRWSLLGGAAVLVAARLGLQASDGGTPQLALASVGVSAALFFLYGCSRTLPRAAVPAGIAAGLAFAVAVHLLLDGVDLVWRDGPLPWLATLTLSAAFVALLRPPSFATLRPPARAALLRAPAFVARLRPPAFVARLRPPAFVARLRPPAFVARLRPPAFRAPRAPSTGARATSPSGARGQAAPGGHAPTWEASPYPEVAPGSGELAPGAAWFLLGPSLLLVGMSAGLSTAAWHGLPLGVAALELGSFGLSVALMVWLAARPVSSKRAALLLAALLVAGTVLMLATGHGQLVPLSVGGLLAVTARPGPPAVRPGAGVLGGGLVFLVGVFGYYAAYDLDLGFPNGLVAATVAVVAALVGVISALRTTEPLAATGATRATEVAEATDTADTHLDPDTAHTDTADTDTVDTDTADAHTVDTDTADAHTANNADIADAHTANNADIAETVDGAEDTGGAVGVRPGVPARRAAARLSGLWRPVVAAVLLTGLSLAAGWRSAPAVQPKAGSSFTLLAYNIRMGFGLDGRLSLDDITAWAAAKRPDVVLLSEVDRGWLLNGGHDDLDRIARGLGLRAYCAPAADQVWGDALLTNLPVKQVVSHPLGKHGYPTGAQAQTAVIEVGGSEVGIVNTHLQSPPGQAPEVAALVRELSAGGRRPVVLAGDLNTRPGDPEMRVLESAGLSDPLIALGNPATSPADAPVERIDHVLVTGGVRVESADVPRLPYSDHLPVMAALRITSVDQEG